MFLVCTMPLWVKIVYFIIALSYIIGIAIIRWLNSTMKESKEDKVKHYLVLFIVWLFSPIMVFSMFIIALKILFHKK